MSRVFSVIAALLGLSLNSGWGYYSLEVGDPCPTSEYRSSCQPAEHCGTLREFIRRGQLQEDAVLNCGFTTRGEKVCCPLETGEMTLRFSPGQSTTTTSTSTSTSTTTTTTAAPPWLSIFKTNREYDPRSVASTTRPSRDIIIFPDFSTTTGAVCQTPLYMGKCLGTSQCHSIVTLLKQARLQEEDVATCRDGTIEEIICCPMDLPLGPRTGTRVGIETQQTAGGTDTSTLRADQLQTEQLTVAKADALLPHYTHLAALAYPNAAFDGHVHRCTALALTPQLLLSAAGCGRPSHVVFGVADLRDVDTDEDYIVDIARISIYRQDLALLRLEQPLRLGRDSAANVSLAPMCSHFELTRLQISGQIMATAWAKGNASDCPLYELPMRLLPSSACKDIPNSNEVQNLPATHLCLGPSHVSTLIASNSSNSCIPCPTVVGSVLHLLRPSGSRCVLGVATPTGANCNADVMYFTNLLDAQLVKFVEQLQQQGGAAANL